MLLAEDRRQTASISAAWNGTGTAPAGSVVNIAAAAGSVLGVQISGTFTATLQFEGRIAQTDDVNDWFAITGTPAAGGAGVTSATAAGRWFVQYAGLAAARVRCSAYTSGTPVVSLNLGAGSPASSLAGGAGGTTVQGAVAPGGATPIPVGVGFNGSGGLIRNMTSALAAYPDNGNLLEAVGPGVFDGANWHPFLGNTDGSFAVGGFTPAAPICTFTRGANATPYTIGDEVGTAGTAPTTITVGRFNGGSGVIQGAQVVYSSYAAIVPQLVLLLFSATVTLAGDNAQLNLSDAHAKLLIGTIPLTASQSGQYSAGAPVAAGNTIFQGVPTAPIHYICAGGTQTIFAALITLNAFTPIANSETLDVTLSVESN